jgi:hypothetical protein
VLGGGEGKRVWEGEYGANSVYVNVKVIPVETILGMGGWGGIKGSLGGGESKYDMFDPL